MVPRNIAKLILNEKSRITLFSRQPGYLVIAQRVSQAWGCPVPWHGLTGPGWWLPPPEVLPGLPPLQAKSLWLDARSYSPLNVHYHNDLVEILWHRPLVFLAFSDWQVIPSAAWLPGDSFHAPLNCFLNNNVAETMPTSGIRRKYNHSRMLYIFLVCPLLRKFTDVTCKKL